MDDLISRQAAIDALQEEISKGIPPFDDVIGSIRCGVRLARNIIEDLPLAQPEQRWIPCSERLPENGRVVLWCNERGSVFTSAIVFKDDYSWCIGKRHRHARPIAWMPLPEAWKGEAHE